LPGTKALQPVHEMIGRFHGSGRLTFTQSARDRVDEILFVAVRMIIAVRFSTRRLLNQ
jgi:hypothetical protein